MFNLAIVIYDVRRNASTYDSCMKHVMHFVRKVGITRVIALAVFGSGVHTVEEQLHEALVRHLLWVVVHLRHLHTA